MAADHDSWLTAAGQRAARALSADLGRIFGGRLHSLVAYDPTAPDPAGLVQTLALVDRLTFDDLAACARRVDDWRRQGLDVPLLLARTEFVRSLDTFPLEYGAILARYVVISGPDPFAGVRIAEADLRRACERSAQSHLIHLREGYLEAGGRSDEVAALLQRSAGPFRILLAQVARLHGTAASVASDDEALAGFAESALGISTGVVREVLGAGRSPSAIVDPAAIAVPYITALERLWSHLDTWQPS